MKQISLHVYQSIDGCPAPSDKHFDAAVDASSCVLIDEETYLRIYMNHLGWPITAKETLVVTNGGIDLTENERVKFIQGDAVAELRQMKEDGDGMVVAYGEEIGALLLDNGLADEITVTTVPVLIGGGEKVSLMLRDGGNIENVTFANLHINTRMFSDQWWGEAEAICVTAVGIRSGED